MFWNDARVTWNEDYNQLVYLNGNLKGYINKS